jgi:hypothetical protein
MTAHLALAREPAASPPVVTALTPAPCRLLQRTCACGGTPGLDGECAECRARRLQRAATGAVNVGVQAPGIVREVLGSGGRPLDRTTRAFMEPRFGHDFSRVRVHTDARAAESAGAVRAAAYTVGSDIAFASGRYRPETIAGRRLLAHELAHVLQQRGAPRRGPLLVGRQDSGHEREAADAARALGSSSTSRLRSLELQRQAPEAEDVEETEEEVEDDPSDVRDGDVPVHATPDVSEAGEEEAAEEPGPLLAEAGESEATPMQSGGAGKAKPKPKPAPPPKKPAPPPRTIDRIEVDQAGQRMTLQWSDGTKEGPRPVSTGMGLPNTPDDPCKTQTEKNCTPNGTFKVQSLGNKDTKNPEGAAMAWYVGFVDARGIGIHDSQPVPGTPASHGCVHVGDTPADEAFAKKINKNVVPGKTEVVVSGKAPTKAWTKPVPKAPAKKPAPKPAPKKKP